LTILTGKAKRLKESWQKFGKSLKKTYKNVDKFSGGVLEIIRVAFLRFGQTRGSEAAASLAYYAFFSIFPMLLVFIAVGSFFVDSEVVEVQLTNLLQGVLPGAEDLIITNIERVIKLRGAVTFFAMVSLIWSATSVFNILAKHINRAFPGAEVPDFIKGRMLGFFMLLALALLMIVAFGVSTLSSLVPVINIPINDKALHETFLWQIGAFLVPIGLNMLMFWAMYQWVPLVKVQRKAAFLGGLVAGVVWELLNNAFTWYLSSGFSRYQLVYGSVTTVVILLFWIYLSSIVILLGAHLTASIHNSIVERPADEDE
jgi:membrane protein